MLLSHTHTTIPRTKCAKKVTLTNRKELDSTYVNNKTLTKMDTKLRDNQNGKKEATFENKMGGPTKKCQ